VFDAIRSARPGGCFAGGAALFFSFALSSSLLFNGFAAGRGQHGAFDLRYFCRPDNIAPPAHAHLSDIKKNAEAVAASRLLEQREDMRKIHFSMAQPSES
jgi:hypothetical protein